MGEMSKEDLLKVGFVLGNATKFMKAFAALSSAGASSAGPAPSSHFAAGGGAAALVHDLASLALSPPPPIPAAAGIARTLASSNFKVIYERTVAPQFQDQVQTVHPSPPTPPTSRLLPAVPPPQAAAGLVLRVTGGGRSSGAILLPGHATGVIQTSRRAAGQRQDGSCSHAYMDVGADAAVRCWQRRDRVLFAPE